MTEDVPRLRELLGRSTALWAGRDGFTPTAWGWTAMSGQRSVDYNVVLCTGDGDDLDQAVEGVLAARVPAVVMVAGPGLAEVGRLVARNWTCVGATPLMTRPLPAGGSAGADAIRLDGVGVQDARELAADVFEVGPELARVALPDPDPRAGQELWGVRDADGRLGACLALVRVQDTVVVWSMATAADRRGTGLGRRVLSGALADAAQAGADRALLYASSDGEPFYRRLGFTEVERWQIWSRPRWVLGRA